MQYKISNSRSERCKKKKKQNKRYESDERNAGIWVRILSSIYSLQGTEATAHSIIINETPAQVFSSVFCESFKTTLLTEHLWATASKEM